MKTVQRASMCQITRKETVCITIVCTQREASLRALCLIWNLTNRHVGELEIDDDGDYWADNDERTYGNVNTLAMHKAHQERFIYSCCNEDANSVGCNTGRHVEENAISKRPCY